MKNGYVYHTKYDTEAAIPPGSIQRAGDNVLAVVRHLLNSEVGKNQREAEFCLFLIKAGSGHC